MSWRKSGNSSDRQLTAYFSTVISGLEGVAEAALKQRINDVRIDLISDGIIVYRTGHTQADIRALSFFSNSFVLFRLYRELRSDPIPSMLHQAVNDRGFDRVIAPHVPDARTSFRIIFREDRLVSVDRDMLRTMEHKLVQIKHLSVNRGKPDLEFWFLARRQGFGVFGLRITRHRDYAKILEKGELRPELAVLMCILSEPAPNDVFIDPFAGSGAIPRARVGIARYKRVIASDDDGIKVEKLRNQVKGLTAKIDVFEWDALTLAPLESESIDKIVTDPPWGLYAGMASDSRQFYGDMLREFGRILRPGGLAVILLANKDLFQEILAESRGFALVSKYDILVSGPKAAVYKLRKRPEQRRGRHCPSIDASVPS